MQKFSQTSLFYKSLIFSIAAHTALASGFLLKPHLEPFVHQVPYEEIKQMAQNLKNELLEDTDKVARFFSHLRPILPRVEVSDTQEDSKDCADISLFSLGKKELEHLKSDFTDSVRKLSSLEKELIKPLDLKLPHGKKINPVSSLAFAEKAAFAPSEDHHHTLLETAREKAPILEKKLAELYHTSLQEWVGAEKDQEFAKKTSLESSFSKLEAFIYKIENFFLAKPVEAPAVQNAHTALAAPKENTHEHFHTDLGPYADLDLSHAFDVTAQVLKEEKEGYLVAFTFKSNTNLKKETLKTNYYFLVDRSYSSHKDRFTTFKKAVSKALEYMSETGSFNIKLFDKNPLNFSEKLVAVSKASLKKARRFLDQGVQGSYFGSVDICGSLLKSIPSDADAGCANLVIILSSGESAHPEKRQKSAIGSLLEKGKERLNVWTAGAGEEANFAFLGTLGSLGGGSFIYSDTYASLPRKVAKAIIKSRYPLVKNIDVAARSTAFIQVHSIESTHPLLFCDQPYTVFAHVDSLEECTLTLRGVNHNRLITIEKSCTFPHVSINQGAQEKEETYDLKRACQDFLDKRDQEQEAEAKMLIEDSFKQKRRI